jgi:peptidoglycan/xylan/chitin deacetylase (PgdA/CDA1 family)
LRPFPARLAASVYYRSLRALRVAAVMRRLRADGLILCYHNVVPTEDDSIGEPGLHLPRDRFERQMRWLTARYDVLSLREFTERLISGATLRSAAVITFDDGYAGVFEQAGPILHALGIPATVFVVTEAVGRSAGFWWDQPAIVESATPSRREKWLKDLHGDGEAIVADVAPGGCRSLPRSHRPADWETIRAWLGNGIDIGVHSATHRSLPTLTDAEIEREVSVSRAIVHRAAGIWPEFFAYPYGRCDSRVRELVRAAGYRAALGFDVGLNDARADAWCLPRINVPAGISDAAFEAWTAGLRVR